MNHEFLRSQRTVEHIDVHGQDAAAVKFASSIADGDPVRQRQIIESGRRYQPPFLAMELVRVQRAGEIVGNLVDINSGQEIPWTGLEGYFVGSGKTPEEIVSLIAELGSDLYNRVVVPIKQGNEYQRAQRYLQTSRGTSYDTLTFARLSSQFGMITGRLRSNRTNNIEAYDSFRAQTYESVMSRVSSSPKLTDDYFFVIPQVEVLPESIKKRFQTTHIDLKPDQTRGYEFMLHAGRALGNNLVRGAMHTRSSEYKNIGLYNTAYYQEY